MCSCRLKSLQDINGPFKYKEKIVCKDIFEVDTKYYNIVIIILFGTNLLFTLQWFRCLIFYKNNAVEMLDFLVFMCKCAQQCLNERRQLPAVNLQARAADKAEKGVKYAAPVGNGSSSACCEELRWTPRTWIIEFYNYPRGNFQMKLAYNVSYFSNKKEETNQVCF